MGHSEKIHKKIYRQPDVNKYMLMMTKVLDFVPVDDKPLGKIISSMALTDNYEVTMDETNIRDDEKNTYSSDTVPDYQPSGIDSDIEYEDKEERKQN